MNIHSKRNTLSAIGLPTAYAIIVRLLFGLESWGDIFPIMSMTFLFLMPLILGALTVWFSTIEHVKSIKYRIFFPWLAVIVFFVVTLVLALEGWACWVMILPVFLVASSIGGLVMGYFKLKNDNSISVSLLALLPLLIAPLEQIVDTIPATYTAYTCIDISASADQIWKNVTRVKEISKEDDKGFLTNFLGLPRPVKAELDYEGVGAYRAAIFTNGLIFNETVTEYKHQKKMVFTIDANTHDIPSTTLDEHILVGGDYFDVLNGTYELEELATDKYRLHLYSHFKMNTTFNFYAGWWGRWIMKDIQNNILKIEKERAERR